jgi:hypothetical protein
MVEGQRLVRISRIAKPLCPIGQSSGMTLRVKRMPHWSCYCAATTGTLGVAFSPQAVGVCMNASPGAVAATATQKTWKASNDPDFTTTSSC